MHTSKKNSFTFTCLLFLCHSLLADELPKTNIELFDDAIEQSILIACDSLKIDEKHNCHFFNYGDTTRLTSYTFARMHKVLNQKQIQVPDSEKIKRHCHVWITQASISFPQFVKSSKYGKPGLVRVANIQYLVEDLISSRIVAIEGTVQDTIAAKQYHYVEQNGYILGRSTLPPKPDLFWSWFEAGFMITILGGLGYILYIVRS